MKNYKKTLISSDNLCLCLSLSNHILPQKVKRKDSTGFSRKAPFNGDLANEKTKMNDEPPFSLSLREI